MQWFPRSVHDQQITSTTMHHKRALAALQAYLRQTKQPWKWKHSFTCTPSWEMQESESKFLTVRQWVLTQGWCGGESLVMGSKKAVKGAETADKIPSHRWQTKAKRGNPASTLHLHFQVKGFTWTSMTTTMPIIHDIELETAYHKLQSGSTSPFRELWKTQRTWLNDQINQWLTDQCLYWMLIKRSVESFAFLQTLDNAFLMQLRKINEKEERKQSIYRVQWDVEKKKKFIWLVNIIRNLE